MVITIISRIILWRFVSGDTKIILVESGDGLSNTITKIRCDGHFLP
jgi:hypothetical protein